MSLPEVSLVCPNTGKVCPRMQSIDEEYLLDPVVMSVNGFDDDFVDKSNNDGLLQLSIVNELASTPEKWSLCLETINECGIKNAEFDKAVSRAYRKERFMAHMNSVFNLIFETTLIVKKEGR